MPPSYEFITFPVPALDMQGDAYLRVLSHWANVRFCPKADISQSVILGDLSYPNVVIKNVITT